MSNIPSSSLYDFVLQQMAAESYFDTADRYATPEKTQFYLELGTNRQNYEVDASKTPNADKYPGLTRMTKAQAEEFVKKFKIIHQWSDNPSVSADVALNGIRPTQPGDAGYLALNGQQILANTGLSATLIQIRENGVLTNNYTLAIRSTEMRPWDKGGDGERDKWGTDVFGLALGGGFALAQLDALEYYFQWLKVNNQLPAGANLNVTGYSLGGHLATVFTEIHAAEMGTGRTYAFNAPGRGIYGSGTLDGMLRDYRRLLANPAALGIPESGSADRDAFEAANAMADDIAGGPRSGEYAYHAQENLLEGLLRMFAASRSGTGLQPGLRASPRAVCSHARRRTSA